MSRVLRLDFIDRKLPDLEVSLQDADVEAVGGFLVVSHDNGDKEFIPADKLVKALVYDEDDGEG